MLFLSLCLCPLQSSILILSYNITTYKAMSGQHCPSVMTMSSLESIIKSSGKPFTGNQRAQAQCRFYGIINHFDVEPTTDASKTAAYRHPLLVRYTYEYSCSKLSQDTFLRVFFEFMELDATDEEDINFDDEDTEIQLGQNLTTFADFLLDNFFLPCLSVPSPYPTLLSTFGSV